MSSANKDNFTSSFSIIFLKEFIYLFLDRGEGRDKGMKKESERNINVWLPLMTPPPGNLARNPGMCPDWESNWRPFGSQAGTQSTELHQPDYPIFCLFPFA